jgi:hypothetical protein
MSILELITRTNTEIWISECEATNIGQIVADGWPLELYPVLFG